MKRWILGSVLLVFLVGCQAPISEASKVVGAKKVVPISGGVLVRWNFRSEQGGDGGLNSWFFKQAAQLEACGGDLKKELDGLSLTANWQRKNGLLLVTDTDWSRPQDPLTSCYDKVLSKLSKLPRKGAKRGRFYLWFGGAHKNFKVSPFATPYRLWGKGLRKGHSFPVREKG